jgi:3-oxoacyl-[acyl-carrier protein] reductase
MSDCRWSDVVAEQALRIRRSQLGTIIGERNDVTDLVGRRALVTGGARGIGAAIVRRLAADGAKVVFTFSSSEAESKALVAEVTAAGGKAVALRADSSDPEQVTDAVQQAVALLDGLDILVNNAGVGFFGNLETLTLDEFDRTVAVNVRGTYCAIKAASPHLGERGRIINIGSIFNDRLSIPELAVYTMTKGAIAGLTRGLTRELAPRGITINNVQPGPTDTDMNPEASELADDLKKLTPLGRYGRPPEVASVVSYLASVESGYVTGVNWNVDGGYAA